MNTVTLTKWGNSAGIRIPIDNIKAANAHIGERFEIKNNNKGGFILQPIDDPQAGWKEAFDAAADAGDDKSIIGDFNNESDEDEWQW